MRDLLLAAVQMTVTDDVDANLAQATARCHEAIDSGANLIALPENFSGIASNGAPPPLVCDPNNLEKSPEISAFFEISSQFEGLLILGGQPLAAPGGKHHNACLVLKSGRLVARYDKIHRFHATMPDGSLLTEVHATAPGDRPVVVDWGGVRVGLGICYDLRFPEHYRALASAKAHILLGPSAFTFATGAAHWSLLLRARALENQAYMVAPAQHGHHAPGRQSWGHSMIVGPWGEILAQQAHGSGIVMAWARAETLHGVRRALPCLEHRVLGPETTAEVVTLNQGESP